VIPLKDQEFIRQKFAAELAGPVKIDFFTQKELGIFVPGRKECPACKPAQEMLKELAALSDWISLRTHIWEEEREEAARYGVEMIPATVLRSNGRSRGGGRDGRLLRFFGLPGGNEFPAFIETIIDVSHGISRLSESSRKQLRKLKQDLRLQVFVTPT
jgi:alkyl hydroperoxide reductase subunit AhpF